jgi:hypothetical protein
MLALLSAPGRSCHRPQQELCHRDLDAGARRHAAGFLYRLPRDYRFELDIAEDSSASQLYANDTTVLVGDTYY